jgi:hypothetical protein
MTLAFIYPHKLTGEFLPRRGHVTQNTVPFHDFYLNKGTGSRDRFQNIRQKLKDLGLNKWRGRFLN